MTEPDARLSEVVRHFDPNIKCATIVEEGRKGPQPWPRRGRDGARCRQPSHYVVARSDGNISYGELGEAESCSTHLAYTVMGMLGGDTAISAIVTVRWDA